MPVNLFPLANERRRLAHSCPLYPNLAHADARTIQLMAMMALRAAVRDQCSVHGVNIPLSGERLGSSLSHHFSGRPFLLSCLGDMSSAAQLTLNSLASKSLLVPMSL